MSNLPLWFTAWRVLDDTIRACCYPCDWHSEPARGFKEADRLLAGHLETAEHIGISTALELP